MPLGIAVVRIGVRVLFPLGVVASIAVLRARPSLAIVTHGPCCYIHVIIFITSGIFCVVLCGIPGVISGLEFRLVFRLHLGGPIPPGIPLGIGGIGAQHVLRSLLQVRPLRLRLPFPLLLPLRLEALQGLLVPDGCTGR
jgi:hypothetical protein